MLILDIADVLRRGGLKVVEVPGWKQNMRPASTGGFAPVANLWHHTGSKDTNPNSIADDFAYAKWLADIGRSDLPAPLCQLSIARDGTIFVCAAGRGNHAGKARPSGPVPGGDGNRLYIGWEVHNNGTEGWSKAQYSAMVRAAAVTSKHYGWTANSNRAHKETSYTGKWDPGGLNMDKFRSDISLAMQGEVKQDWTLADRANPAAYYVGAKGPHVKWLADRLVAHGYKRFYSNGTDQFFSKGEDSAAVRAFQLKQGWRGDDADGLPGRETIRRLAAKPPVFVPPVVSVPNPSTPATRGPKVIRVLDRNLKVGRDPDVVYKELADDIERYDPLVLHLQECSTYQGVLDKIAKVYGFRPKITGKGGAWQEGASTVLMVSKRVPMKDPLVSSLAKKYIGVKGKWKLGRRLPQASLKIETAWVKFRPIHGSTGAVRRPANRPAWNEMLGVLARSAVNPLTRFFWSGDWNWEFKRAGTGSIIALAKRLGAKMVLGGVRLEYAVYRRVEVRAVKLPKKGSDHHGAIYDVTLPKKAA
jgi:N-acetyl-anhydromuramyl-L-alanine amidase AmpD